MRFSKKVAVVTGAGSGIGQAIAVRLADEGGVVVGSDINPAGLDETAEMMGDGAVFHPVVSDVCSREACHEVVASAVAYLASDKAHRFHGAVLSIDAGMTAG